MKPFVLPFSDLQADLETVGGKGMSLAKLSRAGFPVPGGFHITTEAYRRFVMVNDLQSAILKALEKVDVARPATFESASQAIARFFDEAKTPLEISEAIFSAYGSLSQQHSSPPVAVRSSATAEDLPDASFAGQQDTYLNICGAESVLAAVRKCWASLWTGRAIAYRLRQGIASESVALAVVVQRLVPAEAAGILFSANPLTGKRNEIVINAAWGLGEAVVGGMVTPDTITVDRTAKRIIRRETAEKQVMTVCTENGTEERHVPESLKNKAVLSNRQAIRLADYGAQIEELYGLPMDVEWTLAEGQFAILQARPITTLVEAPLEWKPLKPKGIYMRASAVDLMPDPLSPLFATMGLPAIVRQMFVLAKALFRSEPFLPEDYFTTINRYAYLSGNYSTRGWLWILFKMLPAFPRLLRMIIPFWRDETRPKYREAVAEAQEKDIERMRMNELWQASQEIMDAAAYYTGSLLFATMGASAGSEGLLTKVYEKLVFKPGDPPATVLMMGWDNIPSRAEKSLYDLAGLCQEHEQLKIYFMKTPSAQVAEQIAGGKAPEEVISEDWQEFCQCFSRHLEEFGYMVFELDFAKSLPRDHPEPMLETIKMYLDGKGNNPYERQKTNEERRVRTGNELLGRLKGLRRWAFSKSLNWAQSLSEVREDALADIGLGYPLLRRMLFLLGECFVKAGILYEAEDIFWLEKGEIDEDISVLEGGALPRNKLEDVEQRKAFWKKAKQSVPPPMVPPRKKYMGINTKIWLAESEGNQSGSTLKGVPTSSGRVTAPACVLHGPEDFDRMRPGDVLVAGTTTPAWTPLFTMASAVVTDIGGPLSHGSIVAREYGIPAVMGTGVATRRIQDGQIVTVDGGAGTVTLA